MSNPTSSATASRRIAAKPRDSILIQLAKKIVKKYTTEGAKLGRIGNETLQDLTKFAILAGIVSVHTPKLTRDSIRQSIKAWWNQEPFDFRNQVICTLTHARFELDFSEAKSIFAEELGYRIRDLDPTSAQFVVQITDAYATELLDKTLVPKLESDESESDSESVTSEHTHTSDQSDDSTHIPTMAEQKLKLQPRVFADETSEPVTDWLAHFQVVARSLNWSEDYQLAILPAYLKGKAQQFYTRISKGNTPPTTFDEWRTAFIARFRDPHLTETLRYQLTTMRQKPDQTARQFASSILDLAFEIDPAMSQAEICRYIKLGISPKVTSMIASTDVSTMEKLLEAISRVEHTLMLLKLRNNDANKQSSTPSGSGQKQIGKIVGKKPTK